MNQLTTKISRSQMTGQGKDKGMAFKLTSLSFACLLAQSAINPALADEAKQAEFASGMAHYQYYQGDYFNALTELAIAEKKGIANNRSNSDILKAGLQLHFAMDEQAEKIFTAYLAEQGSGNLPVATAHKDFVYYTLAKGFYNKQMFAKAEQALAKVSEQLASEYSDHYYYLSAQVALKLGNDSQAEQAKNNISAESMYHRYLAFNQALKAMEAGDNALAINLLEAVASFTVTTPKQEVESSFIDEMSDWIGLGSDNDEAVAVEQVKTWTQATVDITDELEALVDRANLTLGYLHLEQGDNDLAIASFKQVALESLDTEAALLGYGWALAKNQQHKKAIAVWQQLVEHGAASAYVREAYIAIGLAYEQSHNTHGALTSYQKALTNFKRFDGELDGEINQLAQPNYLQSLMLSEQADKPSQLIGEAVELKVPNAVTNYHLVAHNSFQNGLVQINDLNVMLAQLQRWHSELNDMALSTYGEQGQNIIVSDAIAADKEQSLRSSQLNALSDEFANLNNELNELAIAHYGKLFKTDAVIGERAELVKAYNQYQKVKASVDSRKGTAEYPKLKERLNRVAGALLWQIGDYYLDADGNLAKQQVMNRASKLTAAQQMSLTPVYDLQHQVDRKLQSGNALRSQLMTDMQDQLAQALSEEKKDLNTYIEKARLAMVRLNDQIFIRDQQAEQAQALQVIDNMEGEQN